MILGMFKEKTPEGNANDSLLEVLKASHSHTYKSIGE